MSSEFNSFDESPAHAFTESPLHARNGLGTCDVYVNLTVPHPVTPEDPIPGDGTWLGSNTYAIKSPNPKRTFPKCVRHGYKNVTALKSWHGRFPFFYKDAVALEYCDGTPEMVESSQCPGLQIPNAPDYEGLRVPAPDTVKYLKMRRESTFKSTETRTNASRGNDPVVYGTEITTVNERVVLDQIVGRYSGLRTQTECANESKTKVVFAGTVEQETDALASEVTSRFFAAYLSPTGHIVIPGSTHYSAEDYATKQEFQCVYNQTNDSGEPGNSSHYERTVTISEVTSTSLAFNIHEYLFEDSTPDVGTPTTHEYTSDRVIRISMGSAYSADDVEADLETMLAQFTLTGKQADRVLPWRTANSANARQCGPMLTYNEPGPVSPDNLVECGTVEVSPIPGLNPGALMGLPLQECYAPFYDWVQEGYVSFPGASQAVPSEVGDAMPNYGAFAGNFIPDSPEFVIFFGKAVKRKWVEKVRFDDLGDEPVDPQDADPAEGFDISTLTFEYDLRDYQEAARVIFLAEQQPDCLQAPSPVRPVTNGLKRITCQTHHIPTKKCGYIIAFAPAGQESAADVSIAMPRIGVDARYGTLWTGHVVHKTCDCVSVEVLNANPSLENPCPAIGPSGAFTNC